MEAVMADKSDDSYSYRLDATGTLRSYYSPRYGCYANILGRCISPLELDEIVRNLNRYYKDIEKDNVEVLYTSTNAAKLPLNMKPVFGYVGESSDELSPIRVYCIRNIVVQARGYIRSFIYYQFYREDFEMDELLNQTGDGKPVKESDITIRAVNTIFFSLPEGMKPKVAYTVDEEGVMYPVYAMMIKRVLYSYKNQSCIVIFIQTVREYKPGVDLNDFEEEGGYSVDTTTLYLTAGKDAWRTEPAVIDLRSEEYKPYYDHIKVQEQTQDKLSDYSSSVGYWIDRLCL